MSFNIQTSSFSKTFTHIVSTFLKSHCSTFESQVNYFKVRSQFGWVNMWVIALWALLLYSSMLLTLVVVHCNCFCSFVITLATLFYLSTQWSDLFLFVVVPLCPFLLIKWIFCVFRFCFKKCLVYQFLIEAQAGIVHVSFKIVTEIWNMYFYPQSLAVNNYKWWFKIMFQNISKFLAKYIDIS